MYIQILFSNKDPLFFHWDTFNKVPLFAWNKVQLWLNGIIKNVNHYWESCYIISPLMSGQVITTASLWVARCLGPEKIRVTENSVKLDFFVVPLVASVSLAALSDISTKSISKSFDFPPAYNDLQFSNNM